MTVKHTWQQPPRKRSVRHPDLSGPNVLPVSYVDPMANRTRLMTFRLTEAGYQVLADRAAANGTTPSAELRAMLKYAAQHMPAAKPKKPPPPDPFE